MQQLAHHCVARTVGLRARLWTSALPKGYVMYKCRILFKILVNYGGFLAILPLLLLYTPAILGATSGQTAGFTLLLQRPTHSTHAHMK